ncbi:protease modulator HflC [candidate division KSB1 bacterium]|nr:protease modulator HflC [candidate division KSB1 bacterium]NIR69900.1 protease modulator HflC [candidate division KSB1 bacterium]NIS23002.1 protease modulator HflC [candidate division KSB1 bacterium]NIT69860.1 protease modulator HflC [candidate division KSB1 bacterium]NIU23509.1 protease modulator HflC [candidate division KSB1 bacterium]
MRASTISGIILAVVALIVLMGIIYVVDETEQAVIVQFGDPVGEPITDAGLHFKLPFIQEVKRFDKRVLEWDGDTNQIPTADKKFIIVDTFGRWRIVDALKFLQTVRGDEDAAQSRLDDIIDSATRNFISENLLIEAVRNSSRTLKTTLEEQGGFGEPVADVEIEKGRDRITELILDKAAEAMPEFGIELLDVRIKRINYIEEVREKVYDRMISERKRIAEKFRSEGQGRRAEIDGEREKEFQRITSEAYRKAQRIKGEADAEATRIYANSFGRDPEFYSFMQTLESYRNTMNTNTTLILNTDSEYLQYLKNIRK